MPAGLATQARARELLVLRVRAVHRRRAAAQAAAPACGGAAARNHSSLDAVSEKEARRFILANPDARSVPRERTDYAKGQTFLATVNVGTPSHPAPADEKKAAAAKNATWDDARRDEDAKRKKAEDDKRESRAADAAGPSSRFPHGPPPPSAVAWLVIVSAFAWGLVLFVRRMGFPMVRKHRKSRMLRRRLRAAKRSKV